MAHDNVPPATSWPPRFQRWVSTLGFDAGASPLGFNPRESSQPRRQSIEVVIEQTLGAALGHDRDATRRQQRHDGKQLI